MAGTGGYFLQGLAGGLQTGFNMGQMKWQQNEKKKLEKKQEELLETASVFNNMVSQLGEDGAYSDDDMMKINTSYMALGYDVKERVDGTYKAIQTMDKKTIEANYQWFDFAIEAASGMKSADAQVIWDTVRPFISGEKGLQTYTAFETITKKRSDIMQAQPTAEVFPSAAAVQEAYPDAGYKFDASAGGFVPTFQEPAAEKAPSAIEEKMKYADMLNLDIAAKTKILGGGDSALEEKIKNLYSVGGTDEDVKEMLVGGGIDIHITPETVGTLGTWEERFEKITTEKEFNREQSLLTQSEDKFEPEYKTWKEHLVAEVEGMAKALKTYLDEKGNLKNEDWAASFKENVDTYMEKILEIQQKFPDVDLSKFPKFRGERKSILTVPYGGYIDEKGW